MGVMVWGPDVFEGKYKPIVSQELFSKVQKALKVRSKPRNTRKGHDFPFRGLFRCTCGSMISAQWAKGHGGLYRYYRCTRKVGPCTEPYLQEKFVTAQCLDMVKSLAISTEEANFVRGLIDAETEKEGGEVETSIDTITERLSAVQAKLNRLTRGYLNELIDEESYQTAKEDLVTEKTALKQEKQRLHRTGSSYWNEPAKEVINALELAGKVQTEQSPQEIAQLLHKVGTNLLLSRKTVSMTFSEPYDFVPSFLGTLDSRGTTSWSLCDQKNPLGSQLTEWCRFVRLLRTHFNTKSVLNEAEDSSWSISPHPSPQGEPLTSESTLREKELAPVASSALPPTTSVAAQRFTASASTHVPAPANLGTGASVPSALPTGSREEKPPQGQPCP
jgi:hypothetical protein